MAMDLTVFLENRPGTLADVGEALGKANINIEGGCGFPCQDKGVLHILVDDAAAAQQTLEAAGFEVTGGRPVLVVDIEDRPGEFGKIARRIAEAGANIDLAYLSANGKFVLGVDNLEKARAAV